MLSLRGEDVGYLLFTRCGDRLGLELKGRNPLKGKTTSPGLLQISSLRQERGHDYPFPVARLGSRWNPGECS